MKRLILCLLCFVILWDQGPKGEVARGFNSSQGLGDTYILWPNLPYRFSKEDINRFKMIREREMSKIKYISNKKSIFIFIHYLLEMQYIGQFVHASQTKSQDSNSTKLLYRRQHSVDACPVSVTVRIPGPGHQSAPVSTLTILCKMYTSCTINN